MSNLPQNHLPEDSSLSPMPNILQLGMTGGIGGLIASALKFCASQDIFAIVSWEGAGALIIIFAFFGICFIGGFLGGILIGFIARIIKLKPETASIWRYIAVLTGFVIGFTISSIFF